MIRVRTTSCSVALNEPGWRRGGNVSIFVGGAGHDEGTILVSTADRNRAPSPASDGSVEVARVALLIAALVAAGAAVFLFAGDRRLAAVTIGVWGVAAAVTVYPVLGYIGSRVQQGVEVDSAASHGAGGTERTQER